MVSWLFGLAASGGDLVQMPTGTLVALLGAVAALVLAVAKAVDKLFPGKNAPGPGTDSLAPVLSDLTRAMQNVAEAYGRFTSVLERMETANERNQEAVASMLAELNKALLALDQLHQRLDYRTREIRDDVKALPDRTERIVVAAIGHAVSEIKAAVEKASTGRQAQ